MRRCNVRCVQALDDVACLWSMLFDQRAQAFVNGTCYLSTFISSNRCTHATSYVCMPLMMLHTFDDASYHCLTSLTINASHVRCVKTLTNASYHWMVFLGQSMQSMTDVAKSIHTPYSWCVYTLVDDAFAGRHCLVDGNMPHLCMEALANVVCHWLCHFPDMHITHQCL